MKDLFFYKFYVIIFVYEDKGDLFMDNKYFINEELLHDEENILRFFYLNKSPYHRRQQAYNEKEQ